MTQTPAFAGGREPVLSELRLFLAMAVWQDGASSERTEAILRDGGVAKAAARERGGGAQLRRL